MTLIEAYKLMAPVDSNFSRVEVKAVYRQLVFQYRPDRGQNKEMFLKIQEAYEMIYSLASDTELDLDTRVHRSEFTDDNFLISDLGNGLTGDIMGAKPCDICHGQGWIWREISTGGYVGISTCSYCDGNGFLREAVCRYCIEGKFTLKSGRVVDCRSCKGTGIHVYTKPRMCPHCFGLGEVMKGVRQEYRTEQRRFRCRKCNGTGEIELLNPVIPRSAVLTGFSNYR